MTDQSKQDTILIVDDVEVNRLILKRALVNDYDILEAEDGEAALERLRTHTAISLLILDLQMPKLDGYSVLERMRDDSALRDIPVVIVTASDDARSQIRALDLGAMDVMTKPFHPLIVLHRIQNILSRREADRMAERNRLYEQTLRQADYDRVTGLYSRAGFYKHARERLDASPETSFLLVRMDIDRFKAFNDSFGMRAGDKLLSDIGQELRGLLREDAILARIEGDHFAVLLPEKEYDLEQLHAAFGAWIRTYPTDFRLTTSAGVYAITDRQTDVSLMCDRAFLALQTIKHSYVRKLAWYSESMRDSLLDEQSLTGEMDEALESGQFIVYFQPQVDYAEGKYIGAEALVRWLHPRRGLISPNAFIPLFEKNGFISKLDEYVWDRSCAYMREWLDSGEKLLPISVSVNISRLDIYDSRLCDKLASIVNKYRLPASSLRLEITESVYMEDSAQLIEVVKKLQALGFEVEMDDFGSGYSSLNMLKDVPVDLLKLDMRFLSAGSDKARSGNILSSIIRMAHWLKLPVIAEGVETKAQADYLKNLGAFYMQGYYFGKPMPAEEFIGLIQTGQVGDVQRYARVNVDGVAAFWDASAQNALLFNSFVGGAAIMEYADGNLEAVRINDNFCKELGTTREEYAPLQLHIFDRLTEEHAKRCKALILRALYTGEEFSMETETRPIRKGETGKWLQLRGRLLAHSVDRSLFYVTIDNITERKQLAKHNAELSYRLSSIVENVPGGIFYYEITGENVVTTYFNDTAAVMFGYTREEYGRSFTRNAFACVHPDDLETLRAGVREVIDGNANLLNIKYRHICKDGSWHWVHMTGSVMKREEGRVLACAIQIDIDKQESDEQRYQQQLLQMERQRRFLETLYATVTCGIQQLSIVNGQPSKILNYNESSWRILGYFSEEQYISALSGQGLLRCVHPADAELVATRLTEAVRAADAVDFAYRVIRADGVVRWLRTLAKKVLSVEGDEVLQCVFSDITVQKQSDLLNYSGVLFGTYDEVFEIDSETRACVLRASRFNHTPIGMSHPLSVTVQTMCEQHIHPDDRSGVKALFDHLDEQSADESRMVEFRFFDADGETHWGSLLLIGVHGSSYFACVRDVTNEKEAARLAEQNAALLTELGERDAENERNRLLTDDCDLLLLDYDVASDSLTLRRKLEDGSYVVERLESYAATLNARSTISVSDRERVGAFIRELLQGPVRRSLILRTNAFGTGFACCRAECVSVAGGDGKIVRWVGTLSPEEPQVPILAGQVEAIDTDALAASTEHSSAYAYAVDADTYELLYCNEATKRRHGEPMAGETCYELLKRGDQPCEECPIRLLRERGHSLPMEVYANGVRCVMQAAHITLEGRSAYLITGTDAESFAANPEQEREKRHAWEVAHYAGVLSAVYDELAELDLGANQYTPLLTAHALSPSALRKASALSEMTDAWADGFVHPDDRRTFRDGLNPQRLKADRMSGLTTRFSYRVLTDDRRERWLVSALLPVDADRYLLCSRDATDSIRAAQMLREMEQAQAKLRNGRRFQTVVEQLRLTVLEWNHVSREFYSFGGYSDYAMSGYEPFTLLNPGSLAAESIVHPDDAAALDRFRAQLLASHDTRQELTARLKMKDGSYRWTRIVMEHASAADGEFDRSIGAMTDMDAEIRVRHELERFSERTNAIMDNLPVGVAVYEWGDKPRAIYVNDCACAMFGISRKECDLYILNDEPIGFMPTPESLSAENVERLRSGQTLTINKLRAQCKDGSTLWLRVICSPKANDDKLLLYATLVDVSAEVAAEKKERWQGERYRILSEMTGAITFDYDTAEDLMSLSLSMPDNRVTVETHPHYVRDFKGNQRIESGDQAAYIDALKAASEKIVEGELTYRADYYGAGWRWYRARYASIADESGRVFRVVGRVDDVSEMHQLATRMDVMQKTPAGMYRCVLSEHPYVDYFSDGCCLITGYSRAELQQMFLSSTMPVAYPKDREKIRSIIGSIRDDPRTVVLEYRFVRKDGKVRYAMDTIRCIPNDDGTPVIYSQMMDVTALHVKEQALSISEQEYRVAATTGGRIVFRYNVADKQFDTAAKPLIARMSKGGEESSPRKAVKEGVIAPESVETWLSIFAQIDAGEPEGIAEIKRLTVDRVWRWFKVRYTTILNADSMPNSAILSYEDVTLEREARIANALDLERLYLAVRSIYPMCIAGNLTQNRYYMMEYEHYTTKKAKDSGTYDELIEVGESTVAEEDRERFVARFSREGLLHAYQNGAREARLEHRQLGDDGTWHWIETTVIFVRNRFDSDVLVIALARPIDEQKRVEAKLQGALALTSETLQKRSHFTDLVHSVAPGLVLVWYPHRTEESVPFRVGALVREYGYDDADMDCLLLHSPRTAIFEDDIYEARQAVDEAIRNRTDYEIEYRVRKKDGWLTWVMERGRHFIERDGSFGYIVINLDVSERHKLIEELRIKEKELSLAMSQMGKLIFRYDVTTRTMISPKLYAEQHGIPEALSNMPEAMIESGRICGNEENISAYREFFQRIQRGDPSGRAEIAFRMPDGSVRWEFADFITLFDTDGKSVHALIAVEDVTKAREAREETLHRAEMDGMTGVYNRAMTEQIICGLLAQNDGQRYVLLMIDLDNLKGINDELGHSAGDEAIRGIARLLREHFRSTDVIGRIGGDEFMVLMRGVPKDEKLNSLLDSLVRKAALLHLSVDSDVTLRCSVGATFGTAGETRFDMLYRQADTALYHVKRNGKNDYALYMPEMEREDYRYRKHPAVRRSGAHLENAVISELLGSISDCFPLALSLNLGKDEVTRLWSDTSSALPKRGTLSKCAETYVEAVHPEDRAAFRSALSRERLLAIYASGARSARTAYRYRCADGEYREAIAIALLYQDTRGEPCGFLLAYIVSRGGKA